MPRIPRLQRSPTINLPAVSAQDIVIPYVQMSRSGERLSRSAEETINVVDRVQNAEDHVNALKYENQFLGELDEKLQQYQLRNDYGNYDASAATELSDIKVKYHGLIGDNPRIAAAFDQAFDTHANAYLRAVRAKKIQDITKEGVFQAEITTDRFAQKYAEANTDEERKNITDTYSAQLEALDKANILPMGYAYKKIKGFEQHAEQVELLTGVNSDDPKVIQSTIDKKYSMVDPVTEATLKAHGENRIIALNAKIQAQIDKEKTTTAYKKLSEFITVNGEHDYPAMFRELHNPSFQREQGLTIEQVHSLEIDLRSEQEGMERAKRDVWNRTAIDNFDLKVAGKLTSNMVAQQVAEEKISVPMGEAYLRELSGDAIKVNPKYYLDTLNKALDGKDVSKDIDWGIGQGRMLDTSHAAHLAEVQHRMKEQGVGHYANDEWFKLAKQDLQKFFGDIPLEERMAYIISGKKAPQIDWYKYSEAMSSLMQSIERGNEKGPLKGEDIFKREQEIIKAISMFKAQSIGEKSLSAPDQYGFSIGEIRTNSKGETRKYIGNNQWQKVQ